jgi:hypothetical protein
MGWGNSNEGGTPVVVAGTAVASPYDHRNANDARATTTTMGGGGGGGGTAPTSGGGGEKQVSQVWVLYILYFS